MIETFALTFRAANGLFCFFVDFLELFCFLSFLGLLHMLGWLGCLGWVGPFALVASVG